MDAPKKEPTPAKRRQSVLKKQLSVRESANNSSPDPSIEEEEKMIKELEARQAKLQDQLRSA